MKITKKGCLDSGNSEQYTAEQKSISFFNQISFILVWFFLVEFVSAFHSYIHTQIKINFVENYNEEILDKSPLKLKNIFTCKRKIMKKYRKTENFNEAFFDVL